MNHPTRFVSCVLGVLWAASGLGCSSSDAEAPVATLDVDLGDAGNAADPPPADKPTGHADANAPSPSPATPEAGSSTDAGQDGSAAKVPTYRGRVVALEQPNAPLAGATIFAGLLRTTSDSAGAYALNEPLNSIFPTVFMQSVTAPGHYTVVEQGWGFDKAVDVGKTFMPSLAFGTKLQTAVAASSVFGLVGIIFDNRGCADPTGAQVSWSLSNQGAGPAKVVYFDADEPKVALTAATKTNTHPPHAVIYDLPRSVSITLQGTHPTCQVALLGAFTPADGAGTLQYLSPDSIPVAIPVLGASITYVHVFLK